nr:MAG TPA: hypothetical protein [Caudoviricetes sp.]
MRKYSNKKIKLAYGGNRINIQSPNEVLAQANIDMADAMRQSEKDSLIWNIIGSTATNLGSSLMSYGQQTKAIDTSNLSGLSFAFGGGVPVEVEGQEVAQLPNGRMMQFQGASHEQGGVDVSLPPGTEVYSKRIKIDGVSMADRKKNRHKKTVSLEQLIEKNRTDRLLANALSRQQYVNTQEEEADNKIQNLIGSLLSSPVEKKAMGGNIDGVDPKKAVYDEINKATGIQLNEDAKGTWLGDAEFRTYKGLPNAPELGQYSKVFTPHYDGARDSWELRMNPNVQYDYDTYKTYSDTVASMNPKVKFSPYQNGYNYKNREKHAWGNFVGITPKIEDKKLIELHNDWIEGKGSWYNSAKENGSLDFYNDNSIRPYLGVRLPNEAPEIKPIEFSKESPSLGRTIPMPYSDAFGGQLDKLNKIKNRSNGFMSSLPTMGDIASMIGAFKQTYDPMMNTLANRAGDTPNINAYKNYGQEGLKTLDATKQFLAANRDNALNDLQLSRNAQVDRNNNSARGVNTLRALNMANDSMSDKQMRDVYATYGDKLAAILTNEANMKNQIDQVVMQGEQARDLADRQDRDNFFKQHSADLQNMGQMYQAQGRMMNEILRRNQSMKSINQMSKYFDYDKFGNQYIRKDMIGVIEKDAKNFDYKQAGYTLEEWNALPAQTKAIIMDKYNNPTSPLMSTKRGTN